MMASAAQRPEEENEGMPTPVRTPSPPEIIPFPPYADVDDSPRSHPPSRPAPPYDPHAGRSLPRANHHALEHLIHARQSSRTPPPPYSKHRHRTFSASSAQRRGMSASSHGAPPPDRATPNAHSRASSSTDSPQRKLSPPREPPWPPSPSSKSRSSPPPRRDRTPSPSYASSTASRSPPRYSAEHHHHHAAPLSSNVDEKKLAYRYALDDDNDSDDVVAPFGSPTDPRARIARPFPHARPGGPRRPLVDYIRNEWQRTASSTSSLLPTKTAPSEPHARSASIGSADEAYLVPTGLRGHCSARALRRYVVLAVVLGVLGYLAWFRAAMPGREFRNMVRVGLQQRLADPARPKGWFGANAPVALAGMPNVRALDPALVPGSGHPAAVGRRLVIVGAVHGHAKPLAALLARVGFDPARDHLVTTGEAVGRGPASAAVVDALLARNATLVRGPTEDRTLLAHRDLQRPALGLNAHLPAARVSTRALPTTPREPLALAAALSDASVRYLARSAPILALGPVRGMAAGGVAVARAGLAPYVPLARHDPAAAMTMRSLDLRAHVPSARAAPRPRDARPKHGARKWRDKAFQDEMGRTTLVEWDLAWEAAQKLRPNGERCGVVFGASDSGAGRVGVDGRTMRWSWGVDGGCGEAEGGGELRALVIEAGRKVGSKVRIKTVGVRCEREEGAVGDLGTG